MFEFLFKYPLAAFRQGELVLLGAWPRWLLVLFVLLAAVGLAVLLILRTRSAPRQDANGNAAVGGAAGTHAHATIRLSLIWLLEAATLAVLLTLLWQPALVVTELEPRQNIIAVLVDDSRSMSQKDGGSSREEQAVQALRSGVLTRLERRFQTRLYTFDSTLKRIPDLDQIGPATAPATHIGASLKQLVTQMEGLPLGAVVLLSDGGDNTGGVDRDAINALRSHRVPVHTVGFGAEQVPKDIEVEDVVVPARALAGSRLSATVKFQQRGYAGGRSLVEVGDGTQVLSSRPITLAADGQVQSESLMFNIGAAGAKALNFSVRSVAEEDNRTNNTLARLVNVEPQPRRILYFEGEPRWEYKFIRRAAEDDSMIQLVSMLRTTENKIYRQGVQGAEELAAGFPTRAQDLFEYDALIIGSVDAGYFNPTQQQLIRDFVDRRGGGLLLLGGRQSLADGVWGGSQVAPALPVILPETRDTFHRDPATVSLTPAGMDSVITRLVDDSAGNVERWKTLPYLMDYQDPGKPKPGATVLAEMHEGKRAMPLLVTENYGRGRTAVLATGGTWRWQMSLPLGDNTHDLFWQQLLRWLVSGTRGRVMASVPKVTLLDDGHVEVIAEVRDKEYHPAADARVTARVIGPGGFAASLDLTPVPSSPGHFQADWEAPARGLYVADLTAQRGAETIGSDAVTFERLDGVAESFHTGQNRALLQELATSTGGRYLKPAQLAGLAADIPYSQAGVSVRQTKELWNMPAVFLLILALRAGEWVMRRKWGLV
jgi:uncharacterized membrane protein